MSQDILQRQPITVIQGAQWGSEAKGMVAAALVQRDDYDAIIRTGTVNAGHTVMNNGGNGSVGIAMQQIPVGWINRRTVLVLGPGAYIHPEILAREIRLIDQVLGNSDCRNRLIVDNRCGLHLPYHTGRAKDADRHHKMGATGKGCSEAVVDKIRSRGDADPMLFKDWLLNWGDPDAVLGEDDANLLRGVHFTDTCQWVNDAFDQGKRIMIEGTQGTLLDLHTGPYPYTTHKQTAVGNWVAESGLSISLPYEVALVTRTYPIRVAGNSGPMPGEIDWPTLTRSINRYLESRGLPPRVKADSIKQFEEACWEVAVDGVVNKRFTLPERSGRPCYDFHNFSELERVQHRQAISELHAEALKLLPGPVVEDLRQVFEVTTVTKKLRRIAELDIPSLKYSIMLNRPAYLVFTFINHIFPDTWGATRWEQVKEETRLGIRDYLIRLEAQLRVPIRYVSTGPQNRCLLAAVELGHSLLPDYIKGQVPEPSVPTRLVKAPAAGELSDEVNASDIER
jgi:adenylosuccinate synthase